MGLNAEIQARTYHESQRKPIYVVREIVHFPEIASITQMDTDQFPMTRN